MKVLVLKDERELSKSLITCLNQENYLWEIVPDFKTAMDNTVSFDNNCILLYISLPDGSGLNVLKELKANKKPMEPESLTITKGV